MSLLLNQVTSYCNIVKEHDLNKKKALANETGNRSWSFKIK